MAQIFSSPLTAAITGFDAITANGEIYGGEDCVNGLVDIPGYLEIGTAPDGSTAMLSRITSADALTYGGIRSEVDWTPEDNAERWYCWDMFIPSDFDSSTKFCLMQIHDSPDDGEDPVKFPNFNLILFDGHVSAYVPLDAPSEATSTSRIIGTLPAILGRWTRCCLHTNWGIDALGFLEAAYGGKVLAKEWSRPCGYEDVVGPYLKLGLYDIFHSDFSGERSVWYRNATVHSTGESWESVTGSPEQAPYPVLSANEG